MTLLPKTAPNCNFASCIWSFTFFITVCHSLKTVLIKKKQEEAEEQTLKADAPQRSPSLSPLFSVATITIMQHFYCRLQVGRTDSTVEAVVVAGGR